MASAVGTSVRSSIAMSLEAALRRRQPQCPLSAKQCSLSATRSWSPLPLRSLALFLASCLLFASLAPRASAIADDALVSTSAASRATSTLDPSVVASASAAEDDSISGRGDDGTFTEVPVHVYRDPATGKLVEEAEPERHQRQQQGRDAAVALAAELDALYMEESAPVRGRGNRAAALGRKSGLGAFGGSGSGSGSSNLGASHSAAEDKKRAAAASSASDPTAAAVSASSIGSSRATRGSRRASRRLSFH